MSENQEILNRLLFTKAAIYHSEVGEQLLKLGADVNAVNEYGESILMETANCIQTQIPNSKAGEFVEWPYVKVLLENGINIHYQHPTAGYNILFYLVNGEQFESLQYFVDLGVDVHAVTGAGGNLLHKASGDETVDYLIAKGVDLNGKDNDGYPPILSNVSGLVYESQSQPLVRLKNLVASGLDIHNIHESDPTLLRYLPMDCWEYLLAEGVPLMTKSYSGETGIESMFQQVDSNCDSALLMRILDKFSSLGSVSCEKTV